jgi:hypothetical protein
MPGFVGEVVANCLSSPPQKRAFELLATDRIAFFLTILTSTHPDIDTFGKSQSSSHTPCAVHLETLQKLCLNGVGGSV